VTGARILIVDRSRFLILSISFVLLGLNVFSFFLIYLWEKLLLVSLWISFSGGTGGMVLFLYLYFFLLFLLADLETLENFRFRFSHLLFFSGGFGGLF